MDRIEIGVVARPHGVRGELRVHLHNPESTALDAAEEVWIGGRAYPVEQARPVQGAYLLLVAGVEDRDAADALRGTRLVIDPAALPPTGDPDEFHVHQLEGLRAELPDGSVLGTVREVVHGPGGELLVVARPELPDALVPFVREIVPTVDLDGGRVVLTPPEGLLDLP